MADEITTGPWVARTWDTDPVFNDDGNMFWEIKPETFHSDAKYLSAIGWMSETNARLIAAAPEILAALKGLEPILSRAESNASGNPEWEAVSRRINAARAAVAKAENK